MIGQHLRGSDRWRRYAIPLLAVGALLAAGTLLERSPEFETLKQTLRSKTAHRSAFPGDRALRSLGRLGVVHAEPRSNVSHVQRMAAPRGGRDTTSDFWTVGAPSPEHMPSTTLVPTEARESPIPLMSVYMEDRDLKDLWWNRLERGRPWERGAFVSYFEQGQLRFGSGAGIRLHGGESRFARQLVSFRLYFRETYGAGRFPPGILFDSAADPIRSLVLHGDKRSYQREGGRRLTNPLAYDFARRLGALAPRTQPISFWLNGKPHGLYVLTERLDSNYLQSHYGHQRFTMVRTKFDPRTERGTRDDPIAYLDLAQFAESAHERSLEEIGGRVDLDNLSRWFISLLICGTTDPFQGSAVLDETRPEARWFWINWDMDHSFASPVRPGDYRTWEVDLFHQIVFGESLDPRSVLLNKLIEHHPTYRSNLLNLYAEAVNHRLTREYIAGRLQYYEGVARAYGLRDADSIRRAGFYLARRAPILRKRMGLFLRGGAHHRVRVVIPAGRKVEIDGYPKTADYSGWYFDTVPVKLRVAPEDHGEFAYWQVADKTVSEPEVELTIDKDTRIVAVFADR